VSFLLVAARAVIRAANHSMQRMGASRSGHWPFLRWGRLAPTADAGRWAESLYGRA
jgi:hypothetical protein